MDRCVGEATLIVRGILDEKGNLQVQEVFKGEQPTNVLGIANGAQTFHMLHADMKTGSNQPATNIEVVAFLGSVAKDGWQPVSSWAGIAGIEGTNVFLFSDTPERQFLFQEEPTARRDEHLDRDGFLAAVREQVKLSQQRAALQAMPRSAQRAQKLFEFLVAHPGNYNHQQIVQSLRPLSPEEDQEILKEIAAAADVAAKRNLLDLARELPLPNDAFDSIAPLLDAQNPPAIRRSAMLAISRINPPEATKRILPLLHKTEPELDMALQSLEGPGEVSLDLQVIDALLTLSAEIRQLDASGLPSISDAAHQQLRQQLAQYAHPKLVSFYFSWLPYHPLQEPDFLDSDLQAMLGIPLSRDGLEVWWQHQAQYVAASYDLQESRDQKKWLDAYQRADASARRLLLQLWTFTSATNQLALVKAAADDKTADAAKSAIAVLWKDGRLSNEAKKAMFEKFVEVEFASTDMAEPHGHTDQHELTIHLTFSYPFDTYVNYQYPVALDGKVFFPSAQGGGFQLDPQMKEHTLNPLGGHVPGLEATATLELFQLDHYPGGKDLWRAQWQLGPIKLRDK
jgi:hypothetical protein